MQTPQLNMQLRIQKLLANKNIGASTREICADMIKLLESMDDLLTDLVDTKSSLEIAQTGLVNLNQAHAVLKEELGEAKGTNNDLQQQLTIANSVIAALKEMGTRQVMQVAAPTPHVPHQFVGKPAVHRPDEAEEIIQAKVQEWWESEDEELLLDWYHDLPPELGIPKDADGKLLTLIRGSLHRDLRFHEKCMMRDLARSRLEHLDPADREPTIPKKLDAYKTNTQW